MHSKIIVALPAYNEEAALPKLLDKLISLKASCSKPLHILIVNDGSTDRTNHILEQYAAAHAFIHVLHHSRNKGLGEALKTMLVFLLQNQDDRDIVVTLDADNTHPPKIIPSLVSKLEQDDLDVVVASRFAPGGKEIGLSLLRKLYSRGASFFLKMFFPVAGVRDYSSGYRAYRIGYLREVSDSYKGNLITTNGFECMAELLARFSRFGVKAGEYPLVLEYNLKETPSKMNVLRTIIGYMKLIKKIQKPAGTDLERNRHE